MKPPKALFGHMFPMHPQPLPDELLSSWLMRTAHANGMKLQHFLDVVLGRGEPTLNRDYDRSAPDGHIRLFADATGISLTRLRDCTLRSYRGTFVDDVITHTNSPWILAAGVYHRQRFLHGLQYCPGCLATDPEPYFRTVWRLAFYVECHEHHVQMLDACWHCDAPVIPYRIEQGRRRSIPTFSGRICHACGVDLAHGPQVGLSTRDLEVRLAIATLCTYAWFSTSTFRFRQSDATVDIYNDLRKLCHLVYSRRRKLNQLGPAVRALAGSSAAPWESDTFNLEHTRISGRIEALSLALWLLTDWPDRLHIALGCAGLSRLRMRNAYANWSLGMLHTLARP